MVSSYVSYKLSERTQDQLEPSMHGCCEDYCPKFVRRACE